MTHPLGPSATRADAWLIHLRQLQAFKVREGHANPPQRYRDPDTGFVLGGWLSKQRDAHRQRRLDQQRYQTLVRMGVEFDPEALIAMGENSPNRQRTYDQHREQTWSRALAAAQVFVASGGDLNEVRRNVGTAEAPRLGKWIYRARREFADGELHDDVAEEWERLGLHWGTVRGSGLGR